MLYTTDVWPALGWPCGYSPLPEFQHAGAGQTRQDAAQLFLRKSRKKAGTSTPGRRIRPGFEPSGCRTIAGARKKQKSRIPAQNGESPARFGKKHDPVVPRWLRRVRIDPKGIENRTATGWIRKPEDGHFQPGRSGMLWDVVRDRLPKSPR